MRKIVHIINEIGRGGAENMLYRLLKYSDPNKFHHEVITLLDENICDSRIEELGIKVYALNLKKRNAFSCIIKAIEICKNADLVDSWLYYSHLFSFVIAKVLLRKKIIWNVRHCNLDKNFNNGKILRIIRINSILSRYVDTITYNSFKAFDNHKSIGYKGKASVVIPNGFELDEFKFTMGTRNQIRDELGINGEKVIITVGRWNIQKDYYTLLESLRELKKRNAGFKMVMVGYKLDYSNDELVDMIERNNLSTNMILLGIRHEIPALLSAADIYISSSLGESFSNSIGEAMACELSCVVTDVGDSAQIVGNAGKVVSSKDYVGMAEALLEYIEGDCLKRNERARARIMENYDIRNIVKCFETNFERIK